MVCIPKRYLIAFLAFFGHVSLWQLQNFIKFTNIDLPSHKTQEDINAAALAHRIASTCTCFGGIIATRYGGVITFGIGVALSALVNLLMSTAYAENLIAFVYLEFLDGIFQALAISAVPDIWSRWSHSTERSTLVTFSYAGTHFAFAEFYLTLWLDSWRSFFYTRGILALVWSIIWLYLVRRGPGDDKSLSFDEKQYLSQNLNYIEEDPKELSTYPWTSIRASQPFWILCIISFIFSWGNTFASTDIADYITITSQINTNIITVPSILVYFFVAGYAADFVQRKYRFTTTNIRKFYISAGFLIGILSMGVFISKIVNGVIFFLTFDLSSCLIETAVIVNVIDLSPKYSSLLWGIVKTSISIGELVMRYPVKQFVLKNDLGWEICSHALGTLYIVGALLYYCGGSAELQVWNGVQKIQKHESEQHYKSVAISIP